MGMTLDSGSLSMLWNVGMSAPIRVSAKTVQVALSTPRLRYALSHVRCMALFLASMSRTFFPPFLCVMLICVRFIVSDFSLFHVNLLIWVLNSSSTLLGIPCTLVRYWVTLAICIWIMSLRPSSECLAVFHLLSLLVQFSRIRAQVVAWSMLFPSHAPRILTSLLSLAMWILAGSASLFLLSFRDLILQFVSQWDDFGLFYVEFGSGYLAPAVDTGCTKKISDVENYEENVYKMTNSVTFFYALKNSQEFKIS